MTFEIQYIDNGVLYGKNIEFDSWIEAEKFCNINGFKNGGQVIETIRCDNRIVEFYMPQTNVN